ncbi:toll-like receptor 4 [Engraulis encrasicolus]|uniref:toll-like receptor 4 n=1 Tax=Engraulis encrasicolus TaxID=184585 RepID=UPI002FD58D4C
MVLTSRTAALVVPNRQYSCSRRNMSYIPVTIPGTTEFLDFSFNYLTTLHKDVFPGLPLLQHLDLTRCHIQHIDSDSFINVRNVSFLILTGNPVKYVAKNSFNVFERMHKLVLVDIDLFSLKSLNLQRLASLRELQLGSNHLSSIALPNYAIGFTNLTVLDFHTNNISVIRDDHVCVLRKLSGNVTLVLSKNPISTIEKEAFKGLHLDELDLRDAFSTSATIQGVTGNLSGLHVNRLRIGSYEDSRRTLIYNGFLDNLCSIHIQEMYLYQSQWSSLPSHTLSCLTNCSKISLRRVGLNKQTYLYRNLEEITISRGQMDKLPGFNLSYQPVLKRLVINDNHVPSEFETLEHLPNLEYIDLSGNRMIMDCCDEILTDVPKLRHLNLSMNAGFHFRTWAFMSVASLQVLDIHDTKVTIENQYSCLRNLIHLLYLDLSNSQITFKSDIIFRDLISLKQLKIPGNIFRKDVFTNIFSNLTNLEMLDISSCHIEDIPLSSFRYLHNLKHLAVSENRLMSVDFLSCSSLSNLVSLHAQSNNIASMSHKVLQNLPMELHILDLSFNPIECSCSSLEFISWIINHQSILKNPHQLSCKASLVNSRVIDFDSTLCHKKFSVPIFVSVTMLLILSALVYMFQVYLHKFLFILPYCCRLLRGYRTANTQEYSYDAFVIYSSKDDVWVQDELKENLEKGFPPVRLCLHERDFEAGKSITSNIMEEGIMSSRKVIVVVSQHFIDSSWCQFEFDMAQSWFVLERSARIIIIILEDVEDRKVQGVVRLHKYLNKNTYLKWKGNALSNVNFWTRLRKAIIASK